MIDVAATATSTNQSKVAAAAAEASSGMRVTKPSDDPEAWAAAERASVKKTLTAGASSALHAGKERLEMTDGALGTIGEALSAMQEMAVQGANATYSPSDRKDMAVQIRALMAGAVSAANTKTADGEYVLAGTQSTTSPFSAAGVYTGDATSRALPTSELDVADSSVTGASLTASSGVDVLPLFERMATALENNDLPALRNLLADGDTAIKQVGLARTRTGGTINVLQSALSAHADLDLHLQSEIQRAVESDIVTSASNLSKASQALEASRTVSAFISQIVNPTK